MKSFILSCLALQFFSFSMLAQTWNGSLSTAWANAGNWTPAAVPGANANVNIPGGMPNYPVLPSSISLASLTMAAGSSLNLNGFTLNINTGASVVSSTISGGGSVIMNHPGVVTFNGNTINAVMQIKNYTSTFNFLNNIITGNTILKDSIIHSGVNYIDGNDISGDLSITHSSAGSLYEGYGGNVNNHVSGNVVLNIIQNGADFFFGYSHHMIVDGNLTVTHSSAGNTEIFQTPGSVGGNLSISNTGGGTMLVGNVNATLPVGGTVNINSTSCPNFALRQVKNQIAGGSITLSNPGTVTFLRDTLKAVVSITNYANTFNFLDNSVLGNVTLSNAIAHASANYLGGNLITGNLSYTHNSLNAFYEGYGGTVANHVTGNVNYTCQNAGSDFRGSYALPILIDGNLTVAHTSAGSMSLFEKSCSIAGNFNLTCSGGGSVQLGNMVVAPTNVSGTVNLNCSSISSFVMERIMNNTSGGTISVIDPVSVSFQRDTIMSHVNITGYTAAFNFLYNQIHGNVSLLDSLGQLGNNHVGNNDINGNLTLTHISSNALFEGYPSSNHITGNTIFNIQSTGNNFNSCYSAPSVFDGNFTVNHAGTGSVELFMSSGTVGGNFSLNSVTGGFLTIGHANLNTNIGGTVNITSAHPAVFTMQRLLNAASGGSISITAPGNVNINRDSLMSELSVSAYYGGLNFVNNTIETTEISDSIIQSGQNNIGGNVISGDFTHTHNSPAPVYEGYGASSGNVISGNAGFNIQNAGNNLNISYSYPIWVGGHVTVTHSTAGTINIFSNNGAQIGGNFSLLSSGTGSIDIGHASLKTTIGGTINITSNQAAAFNLGKVTNGVAGGNITITGPGSSDIRDDTLKANLTLNGYTGTMYFLNNAVLGNVAVSDAASHNATNHVGGNFIDGDFSLSHNAGDVMYEGYGAVLSGEVTGNAIYQSNGSGLLEMGFSHGTKIHRNLTMTSNAGPGFLVHRILFTDTTDGHIIQGGTLPITFQQAFLNKSAPGRLYLDHDVTMNNVFTFTSGYLVSSPAASLIFKDNITYAGAADNSHVIGSVTKIGNHAFIFPVGNGTALQTLSITAPALATDVFRASLELKKPDLDGYPIATKDGSLLSIAPYHYWNLERLNGSANVTVTLGWGSPCVNAGINNLPGLAVSRWNGTMWTNAGNSATTGSPASGTVTQTGVSSSFGPFALATTSNLNNWTVTTVSGTNAPVCSGAAVTLTASGAVSYTWMPGNLTGANVVVYPLATTTYTVSGVSATGCLTTATKTIIVNGLPPLSTSVNNAAICTGGSATITASGAASYSWQPGGMNGAVVTVSPAVTTTYTVTGVTVNGCTQSATRLITVGSCAACDTDVVISTSPYNILLTESVSYIETNGTVTIDSGAYVKFDAAPAFYVLLKPGFLARYGSVFIAQAFNGCSAGAPQLPSYKSAGGQITADASEHIFVYPNPATGRVTILHPPSLSIVQLFDLLGKKVKQVNLSGNSQTDMDIGDLPNGVYILYAHGYTNIKIIKN